MSNESVKRYGHLVKGGIGECSMTEITINLTQEEACAVLAAYDDGITLLNKADLNALRRLIDKLKDQIWP